MPTDKQRTSGFWNGFPIAITYSIGLGVIAALPAITLERQQVWGSRTTEALILLAAYFGGIAGMSSP